MGSAWTDHVTKFFREKKIQNPAYTFKQALKEAGKTFKKGTNAVARGVKGTVNVAEEMIHMKPHNRKTKKGKKSTEGNRNRKPRKTRKAKKSRKGKKNRK